MERIEYQLWENPPGTLHSVPKLTYYPTAERKTDGAMLIIPGSAYHYPPADAPQEGERVAEYFCDRGVPVFVLDYRVEPDRFPLPILDGRRAMRYIRYYSDKFGINKDKIVTVGYSSGGHLAASLTSYLEPLEYEGIDAIDTEPFVPNLQVLCYPVLCVDKERYYAHIGSADNLLAERYEELKTALSYENTTVSDVPPTFIWHCFDDPAVHVTNSLKYAEKLKQIGTSTEVHIFPDGGHGFGLPIEDDKVSRHDRQWIDLLTEWLAYRDFLK